MGPGASATFLWQYTCLRANEFPFNKKTQYQLVGFFVETEK